MPSLSNHSRNCFPSPLSFSTSPWILELPMSHVIASPNTSRVTRNLTFACVETASWHAAARVLFYMIPTPKISCNSHSCLLATVEDWFSLYHLPVTIAYSTRWSFHANPPTSSTFCNPAKPKTITMLDVHHNTILRPLHPHHHQKKEESQSLFTIRILGLCILLASCLRSPYETSSRDSFSSRWYWESAVRAWLRSFLHSLSSHWAFKVSLRGDWFSCRGLVLVNRSTRCGSLSSLQGWNYRTKQLESWRTTKLRKHWMNIHIRSYDVQSFLHFRTTINVQLSC